MPCPLVDHILALGCYNHRIGYPKERYGMVVCSPGLPGASLCWVKFRCKVCPQALPRESKYPIFKDSGPKKLRVWFFEPETSNIGY